MLQIINLIGPDAYNNSEEEYLANNVNLSENVIEK